MINQSYSSSVLLAPAQPNSLKISYWHTQEAKRLLTFLFSSFLVSIPVFFQAPLVRVMPWISLGMTLVWVILGLVLLTRPRTQIWGDLLLGFSWSWLAGSIYWGWFRWEPSLHLPIEAIGLPVALWGLWRGWGKIGNLFYLGSLLGTAMTDLYFYQVGLIPYWRAIMRLEPQMAGTIFRSALTQMQSFWGMSWAVIVINLLLWVGLAALQSKKNEWWALSGAVLSTILVDGLFWLVASLA